jgi:hypothetical protein
VYVAGCHFGGNFPMAAARMTDDDLAVLHKYLTAPIPSARFFHSTIFGLRVNHVIA